MTAREKIILTAIASILVHYGTYIAVSVELIKKFIVVILEIYTYVEPRVRKKVPSVLFEKVKI